MEKQDSQDFYSHAPRGARLCCCSRDSDIFLFLLTRPSRGATVKLWFIICSVEFLLTRPSRGATLVLLNLKYPDFISTHTPLAGTDSSTYFRSLSMAISTHTPLAGRDQLMLLDLIEHLDFYSHAPRGARREFPTRSIRTPTFLLTRPSRGATDGMEVIDQKTFDFYSHAPRGARRASWEILLHPSSISTHTPLAGRDTSQTNSI